MEPGVVAEQADNPETSRLTTEAPPSDEAAAAATYMVEGVAASESGSTDSGDVLQEGAAPGSSDTNEASAETTVIVNAAPPPVTDDAAATSEADKNESSAVPTSDASVVNLVATEPPAVGMPAAAESDAPASQGSEQHDDEVPIATADEGIAGQATVPSDCDEHPQRHDRHEDQPPEPHAPASSTTSGPTSDDVASKAEVNATISGPPTSNPTAPIAPRRTFLSSLTAQFTEETKRAWADVFGVRYELDEPSTSESDRSTMPAATTSKTTRRADAGENKHRGEQIQASRQRYRDRIRQLAVAAAQQGRPQQAERSPTVRKPSSAATLSTHYEHDGTTLLERSGLSLTQIRFCQERALDETCRTFRQIHVEVLDEDGPRREHSPPQPEVQHGVFLTQWELEQALRDSQASGDDGEEGSAIDPAYAEVPIETLLQASWFLPFDQLPRLRTLVLQITRRHLNEHRLARLNRFLRKQLLWIPHSTRLQHVMLGLTATPQQAPEGSDHDTGNGATTAKGRKMQRSARLQSNPALIRDFAACLAASPRVPEPTDAIYCAFLSSSPVELASKWKLGNVLTLQRLVFFRFLAINTVLERRKMDGGRQSPSEHRSKRDTLVSAARRKTLDALRPHHDADSAKPRKRKVKGKRRRSSVVVQDEDNETEKQQSSSDREAEDSAVDSADEEDQKKGAEDEGRTQQQQSQGGIEAKSTTEDASSRVMVMALKKRLEDTMKKLELAIPSLPKQQTPVQPPFAAVKASYEAAASFHQRISAMTQDNVVIDADSRQHLQQLVEALDATVLDKNSPKISPGSPHRTTKFPPPYPESIEENQSSGGDDNDDRRMFPPPYVKTTPAFWTFDPEIDPPKPSLAQQHADRRGVKNPSHMLPPPAFTSRGTASKSPGVGSYDIRQSDHLTFPERPSYSFAPLSSDHSPATSRPFSTSKNRVWKSSLAYPPPLPGPEEDDDDQRDEQFDMAQHLTEAGEELAARAEAETQCNSPQDTSSPSRSTSSTDNSNSNGPAIVSNTLDVNFHEALRLQQRMFVDNFVQTVASRQRQPPESTKTTPAKRSVHHRTVPPSLPNVYWRSSLGLGRSDKSRFVSRMRQRRASASLLAPKRDDNAQPLPTTSGQDMTAPPAFPPASPSSKAGEKPAGARASNSVNSATDVRKLRRATAASSGGSSTSAGIALPSPDGRVEPSAEHLAWATRVGELYAQSVAAATATH